MAKILKKSNLQFFQKRPSKKVYKPVLPISLLFDNIQSWNTDWTLWRMNEEKLNTGGPWFKMHRQPFGSLIIVTTDLLLNKFNFALFQVYLKFWKLRTCSRYNPFHNKGLLSQTALKFIHILNLDPRPIFQHTSCVSRTG